MEPPNTEKTLPPRRIGDNSGTRQIGIEVRAFNSLNRYLEGATGRLRMELPLGATVGDILNRLQIPDREVFLVLCNGRDITPELNGRVRRDFQPQADDVIALSGPIPYSWGYGAPVV